MPSGGHDESSVPTGRPQPINPATERLLIRLPLVGCCFLSALKIRIGGEERNPGLTGVADAGKAGLARSAYEDFEIGDLYRHAIGRTITATDNIWFTLLTVNTNPIHFDKAYAEQTEFGRLLVDSTFTLALVTGLSVSDVSMNAVNLGWNEVLLPAPVFEGDTLHAYTEVLDKRESRSRPGMGIVHLKTTGFNQSGVVVIEFKRTILAYKRAYVKRVEFKVPSTDPTGT